jgi:Glycosyltransferase family 87
LAVPYLMALVRVVARPAVVGGRRFPSPGLIVLASIGGLFLLVVATTSWRVGSDELAYWHAAQRLVAGQPLYDPSAAPNTPYAYWYPPPLAQVLAPLTPFVAPEAFTLAWTAVLLGCLWWLGGRDVLVALALIAFLPVAVELRTRNVHLILAVLVVLALRRSWVFWVPAAALKVAPVLGVLYLAAAGRIREALGVSLLGAAVLAVSAVLAPDAWRGFLDVVGARAGSEGGALVAVPFWIRLIVGAILALVAGRLSARPQASSPGRLEPIAERPEPIAERPEPIAERTEPLVERPDADPAVQPAARFFRPRLGEVLLVVALTIANPTLWATALSLLIAIVPLLRTAPRTPAAAPLRTTEAAPATA